MMIVPLLITGALMAGDEAAATRDAVQVARQALAREISVDAASLELVTAEPVEWRDSSLGCPRKGMVYAQVITPGYRVTFRHAGRSHVVHVGSGRAVVCESPAGPKEASLLQARAAAAAGARARDALARQLGADPSTVEIVRVRPSAGSAPTADSSPTANPPATAQASAFRVELKARGRAYFCAVRDDAVSGCLEEEREERE